MERSDTDKLIHEARGLLNTLALNVALLQSALSTPSEDAAPARLAAATSYAKRLERDVKMLAESLTALEEQQHPAEADEGA